MKFLVVFAVVGFVLWLMFGRGRSSAGSATAAKRSGRAAAPVPIVTCTHCGLHLPQTETVPDAAGRLYCSEAHRLAGPR